MCYNHRDEATKTGARVTGLPAQLFHGADQPLRRGLGIRQVAGGNGWLEVATRDRPGSAFHTAVELRAGGTAPLGDALVVPPLSGHFPILLRDLAAGLLPWFQVTVVDWHNVRHVAAEAGSFGLDNNIATVRGELERLGPDTTVIGVCQGGAPALAASALIAAARPELAPRRLVLMGAPIEPLANPTRVVNLVRSQPRSWFEATQLETVPPPWPGTGRRVYPARAQLQALWLYLMRTSALGGEMLGKLMHDDGLDAQAHPFLDAFTSIMDLDARLFLDCMTAMFHDSALAAGTLTCEAQPVDAGALTRTRLLTIEGALDDIAAPGQTSAALALARNVARENKAGVVIDGLGHMSLFHGASWRGRVLPALLAFCEADARTIRITGDAMRQRR